jgi:anti-sigma B factor antagonist
MHGRITIGNSPEMRQALSLALRRKPAAVSVDLSDVPYIDTSGLATLVEAARIAREQGSRLLLSSMQAQPSYLFEITSLNRFFDMSAPEVEK